MLALRLALLTPCLFVVGPAWGQLADKPQASDRRASREVVVGRGVAFLVANQGDNGAFSPQAGPGVTALAALALIESGRTTTDPAVAKALEYILNNRRKDGGIYGEGSLYRNCETCLAITCLAAANENGRYDDTLKGAEAFVKGLQVDESGGKDPGSFEYGGAGYGNHQRPDLSNTSFFIDALKAMGAGPDDEAMQRALVFVSRCQNLETEHNQTPHAAKVGDGGFYYTAAAGGQSQAGETPNGGLRSYGSTTYAGLKSMTFAGVDRDDPRVKAATKWIQQHYTLKENPGMGTSGQFYHYHTFAKALAATGMSELEDSAGTNHEWRIELVDHLASVQGENGSWVNSDDRWLEGDPNLVTSYCLLALSYCDPAAE